MTQNVRVRGFDFHCHVDLHEQPSCLIAQCEEQGIAVLAVTTTPKAWPQNQEWTKNCSMVHSAVGLHPELIGERYHEADMLEELIEECRLIGEIGLDGGPQYRAHYEKQKDVFARVLRASQAHGGRLLSIHSRRASSDVMELIEEHTTSDRVTIILHWFSGSKKDMRRAVEWGCYFSVNEAMLASERGRSLVAEMPADRLLTETDAPLASVDRKPLSPLKIRNMPALIAEVRSESPDDVLSRIHSNSKCVLGVAGISLG